MSNISNWLPESITWTEVQKKIIDVPKPILDDENYLKNLIKQNLMKNKLLYRILAKVSQDDLEKNIQGAYPIIHEYALQLCADVLLLYQTHGTKRELKYYKKMNLLQFIDIIFKYRSPMFPVNYKWYRFYDGRFRDDKNIYTRYASDLSDYLSVSSYTYVVKDKYESTDDNNYQVKEVIMIELIKPYDEAGFIITNRRSKHKYYKPMPSEFYDLFSNFYKEKSLVLQEAETVEEKQRIRILENGHIFDTLLCKKRVIITCDTLLLEANHKAKERKKWSYLFILRFGFNSRQYWNTFPDFEDIFMDIFGKRICYLGRKQKLNHISDIHFIDFGENNTNFGYSNEELFPVEGHPNGGIKIFFSNQNPFRNFEIVDKLQVIAYPGNFNSFPEDSDIDRIWRSSTCNLNPFISNNRICANNLMVATFDGVMSIQEYFKVINLINNTTDYSNAEKLSSGKDKIRSYCCVL